MAKNDVLSTLADQNETKLDSWEALKKLENQANRLTLVTKIDDAYNQLWDNQKNQLKLWLWDSIKDHLMSVDTAQLAEKIWKIEYVKDASWNERECLAMLKIS